MPLGVRGFVPGLPGGPKRLFASEETKIRLERRETAAGSAALRLRLYGFRCLRCTLHQGPWACEHTITSRRMPSSAPRRFFASVRLFAEVELSASSLFFSKAGLRETMVGYYTSHGRDPFGAIPLTFVATFQAIRDAAQPQQSTRPHKIYR